MSKEHQRARLSRRDFLRTSAVATLGLVTVACVPATPTDSGAASGSQAPAVVKAKVATNDFEAQYDVKS